MDINRYWTGVIGDLNDYAKKKKLNQLRVIRRTEDDGQEFIEIRRYEIPLHIQTAPSRGYGVLTDGEIKPQQINEIAEKIKAFLDGAAFILELNHFHSFDTFDNLENFRMLAYGFDFLYGHAIVNNPEHVNRFLWNHLQIVEPISQFLTQLETKFKRLVKAEISVFTIYPEPKEYIGIRVLLNTVEERAVFDDFVNRQWKLNSDKLKDNVSLSYSEVWNNENVSRPVL